MQTVQGYKRWRLQWVQFPGQDDSVKGQTESLQCVQRFYPITSMGQRRRGGCHTMVWQHYKTEAKEQRRSDGKEDLDPQWGSITNHCFTCFSNHASFMTGYWSCVFPWQQTREASCHRRQHASLWSVALTLQLSSEVDGWVYSHARGSLSLYMSAC